jgi:hypothetical protein
MNKKQATALIFVSWLMAAPALAEPNRVNGTWYFYFSGVPFAKLWTGVDEPEAGRFTVNATLKSLGIVRMFKVIKTSVDAEVAARTNTHPRVVWQKTQAHGKDAHTHLSYNALGELIAREVHPEDGLDWRPRVPDAQVTGAYSWSDLLFGLRAAMMDVRRAKADPLRFKVYDGKRLIQLNFAYQDTQPKDATDRFLLTREYLAGFTPKELKRWQEGEPPVEVFLRQSDGFPVMLRLKLPYGVFKGRWEAG